MLKVAGLVGALALCGVGCADGGGADEPGPDGPVGDEGRVEIALEVGDVTVADGWTAIITATPSGAGTTARIERAIAGAFVETMHLKAGSYRIGVEIYAPDDPAPALSGEQSGISVIAGALTAVTIPLVPSGGVQVWAHLPSLGNVWTCEGSLTLEATASNAFGTQRIERSDAGTWRPVYYLWTCADSGECWRRRTDQLAADGGPDFSAASPSPAAAGGDYYGYSYWAFARGNSVMAEGARFVTYARLSPWGSWVMRLVSDDGLTWRYDGDLSSHPVMSNGDEVPNWYTLGCGAIADDRVRLFCSVSSPYSDTNRNTARLGIVGLEQHADGTWDELPPWDDDADRPDYLWTSDQLGFRTYGLVVLGALHAGGAFRLILSPAYASPTTGVAQQVQIGESLDGEGWSFSQVLAMPSCYTASERPPTAPWAIYDIAGALHAYSFDTKTQTLIHMKSVR